MVPLIQNQKNIVLSILCLVAGFFLVVSQSLPAHAARMRGNMGEMKGGDSMMIKNPEDQAMAIAEKLSLTEEQKIEVVYLLENMFKQQSAYLQQAKDYDESSRTEIMEKMKEARNRTIQLVGDFLNDSQLARLTELLHSSMKKQAGGSPSGSGGRGGRPLASY